MIQLNETLLVIILTWCIGALFGMLIARATHNALIQHNSDLFARTIRYCNKLDHIRDLVISEQINLKL